jgi:hypothetical protein
MSESAKGIRRTEGAGILESWKKRFLAVESVKWVAPLANVGRFSKTAKPQKLNLIISAKA